MNSAQLTRAREFLHAAGVRVTDSRAQVVATLMSDFHPLTSQELLARCLDLGEINRVTVYRVLELLVERQLAEKIIAPDRSDRYCLSRLGWQNHHAHFYCQLCQSMHCLPSDPLKQESQSRMVQAYGTVTSWQGMFEGVCRECEKKSEKPPFGAE